MPPIPVVQTDLPGPRFRPDLQGVRAVAVALVLAFHAELPGAAGGYLGVDVFLVLSGYLVTAKLVEERRQVGSVDLIGFARARFLRLAPTAVVVAASTLAVALALGSPLTRPRLLVEAAGAFLGYENVLLAVQGVDYLQDETVSVFRQFWSLGLEVQFYAVWPLVLVLSARRAGARGAARVACWGLVLSLVAIPLSAAVADAFAFFMLPSRAWEFLAGAVVAIVPAPVAGPRTWATVRGCGLAAIVLGVVLAGPDTVHPGPLTMLPVAGSVALVLPGVGAPPDVVQRLLAIRPLVALGGASYSVYLWHWPLLALPVVHRGAPTPWPFRILLVVAAIIVGIASASVLERRARRRLASCRNRILAVLAASVVVAVLVVPSAVIGSSRTATDVPVAAPDPALVDRGPVAPRFVPSNVTPALPDAVDDLPFPYAEHCVAGLLGPAPEPCSVAPERARRVALIGDSHAVQWADLVRQATRKAHVGLTVYGRAACPFADVRVVNPQLGREYRECEVWRHEMLARLRAERPAVVVVSEATTLYRGRQVAGGSFDRLWSAGVRRSLAALPAGTRVVFVQDTPIAPSDPNECLVRNLERVDRCAQPASSVLDADVRRWVWSLPVSVDVVDPVPALCSDTCSPVLWNILVQRDRSHLTTSAALTFGGGLSSTLLRILKT